MGNWSARFSDYLAVISQLVSDLSNEYLTAKTTANTRQSETHYANARDPVENIEEEKNTIYVVLGSAM